MVAKHIPEKEKIAIFEFMYAYARLEYCLKLKIKDPARQPEGKNAEADWDKLVKDNKKLITYKDIPAGKKLFDLKPKKQVFGDTAWVEIKNTGNELNNIVSALKTVRNNLFHGGKELEHGFDYSDRNMELVNTSLDVVHQIIKFLKWEEDFSPNH
ncbi:hypothetical protein [Proteus terrae]|uniref:hypothetical protein n=1 Tax=Proteus terrae TaxID=1574161 RepID=UPI000D69FB11|nr:hypothetical protein [Proteus terrae]